jgi:hypothetical protein
MSAQPRFVAANRKRLPNKPKRTLPPRKLEKCGPEAFAAPLAQWRSRTVDKNRQTPPFAQDFAAALADDALFEIRQIALAAVTDALSSLQTRNLMAHLLREKFADRELEIVSQYHRPDDD